MKRMKFVIVGHRSQGGGAVVQHSLCKMLEELGQNAKIIYFARGNYDNQSHLKFWLKCLKAIKNYILVYEPFDTRIDPGNPTPKTKIIFKYKCY